MKLRAVAGHERAILAKPSGNTTGAPSFAMAGVAPAVEVRPLGHEPHRSSERHDEILGPDQPMAGYTVAITADRRADEQAELLRRRGAEVLHGATIKTLPLDDTSRLRHATTELIAHPPDVVALSTAIGVRSWLGAAESLGLGDALYRALDHALVLARGPKAAGAATGLGVEVDGVITQATHEELLDRIATLIASHTGGRRPRVAVQLDGAGQPTTEQLRALGADVIAVPVYRWVLPEDPTPAERVITAVAERAVDAVTFTSAHAVSNFVELATTVGLLHEVRTSFSRGVLACAVGPVTADRLRASGVAPDPIEPVRPRLGSMVQALASALSARRTTLRVDKHEVTIQGRLVCVGAARSVMLTDRERKVLAVLVRRPGAVVSKQELLGQVWGHDTDPHVVEVTVGRLRRRLGEAGIGVETVMRRGYRLAVT